MKLGGPRRSLFSRPGPSPGNRPLVRSPRQPPSLPRPRILSSPSNLPFGSGVTACVAPQAHQTRVSALSGRGNRPIRPVMREPLAEESASGSRFPAAFRPPAFASRVFLRPPGDSASLTVGLPAQATCRTPSGLSRSACMRYGRGGCPLYPGDGGALPASSDHLAGTCRLPAAGPYLPLPHPTGESHS